MFPYQLVFALGLLGIFFVMVAVFNTAAVIADRLKARKAEQSAVGAGLASVRKAA